MLMVITSKSTLKIQKSLDRKRLRDNNSPNNKLEKKKSRRRLRRKLYRPLRSHRKRRKRSRKLKRRINEGRGFVKRRKPRSKLDENMNSENT